MSLREDAARQLLIEGQDALDAGKVNQARTLLKKSLEKSPSFDAAFLTALTYGQQENLKMAANYFRQATQIDPTIDAGHYNLGYALQLLKDFAGAKAAYLAALNIRPAYHEALHNLGVAHEELGEFDEAITQLEEALKLNPEAPESLYNLGSVLMKLGKNDEALENLDHALKLMPNHLKALNNRGLVYMAQQRFREAVDDFSKAIAIDPEDAELHFNKGQAAIKRKALAVAAEAFEKTVKLDPEHADAWLNRAFALEQLKQNEEATACFERFVKLRPNAAYGQGYLHSSRMHLCDWRDYEKSAATIMARVEKGEPAMVPHGLTLLPSKRHHQQQAASIWTKNFFSPIKPKSFEPAKPREDNRIRIAYFSADFHNHPVAILTARLFELHDRKKFEVFAFSLGMPSRDAMRLRIEQGVDHFINVREMSDMEIVDRAREEGIDIAIDMTGYTADNRTPIFVLRTAPVQVNYLGYSATMGADFIDYIIGDPVLIPPSHDVDYTEKVARLPDTYMPCDPTREVSTRKVTRAEYGLPDDGFVFCAFNNPYKIAPPQFDLWMRILSAVPGSVLWLSPATPKAAANLQREARQRGVDPARIIFSNRENNLADHIARKGLADLFLDSLPHNAHATANDALWAGLPILTRLGEGFAGRVAGSLVTAIGMTDMIVADGEEYVRRAIEIATTPGLAAQLKTRLAENKKTAPLFHAERYAQNLEKAYVGMHERRCAGLPPEAINVE